MTTLDQILIRARQAAAGTATRYKLGAGGLDPAARRPINIAGECDCSGFVCWCLGLSRKTSHPLYVKLNGGWINTDAIVHDARSSTGFFSVISAPRPGALIVFPAQPPKSKVGHVGIVTAVNPAGTAVAKVFHCSAGNNKTGNAIQETPPIAFTSPQTIYAWYEGIAIGDQPPVVSA